MTTTTTTMRKVNPSVSLPALLAVVYTIISVSLVNGFGATTTTTTTKTTPFSNHNERILFPKRRRSSSSRLFYEDKNGPGADWFDTNTLQARLLVMRKDIMEKQLQQPPNPSLSPHEFVEAVLRGLLHSEDPLPDSGFRLLLRASTPEWASKIYASVGAPSEADVEVVASALGAAIARPNNQFAILSGEEDTFYPFFTTDALDHLDGTCWVSCELRETKTDRVLVSTGWMLKQRASDSAWLIDELVWHDYRDNYRPGIGREEVGRLF